MDFAQAVYTPNFKAEMLLLCARIGFSPHQA
jgi:hypothetical protein